MEYKITGKAATLIRALRDLEEVNLAVIGVVKNLGDTPEERGDTLRAYNIAAKAHYEALSSIIGKAIGYDMGNNDTEVVELTK